jgi:hypothetical protein
MVPASMLRAEDLHANVSLDTVVFCAKPKSMNVPRFPAKIPAHASILSAVSIAPVDRDSLASFVKPI